MVSWHSEINDKNVRMHWKRIFQKWMCSLCDQPKGLRSVWKVPDGWSGPGHWDQNKRAADVSVGLPHWEGQSKKQLLLLHVDAVCAVVGGQSAHAWKDKSLCLLFYTFSGDFWCVPDPSATRGLHYSQCPLCWFPHTARATRFLKQSSAASSLFILVSSLVLSGCFSTAGPKAHLSNTVGSFYWCCSFLCLCCPGGFCPLKCPFHTRAFRFYFYPSLFWWEINEIFGFSPNG